MRIILFSLVFLPILLQANSSFLHGEWIGANKDYRLILKFDKSKSLEINTLKKKSSSIYPQKFKYVVKDNNLYLLDNNAILDSFQIVKLKKDELIIVMSEIKMAFYKSDLHIKNFDLDSFIKKNSFSIKFSNKVNSDTISYNRNYQIVMRNGIPCQSEESNTLTLNKIHKSYILKLSINNEIDEIFIEEIKENKIIGKTYLNNEFIKVEIVKFKGKKQIKHNKSIKNSKQIHDQIIGNWVWIADKKKFLELKEKKHNSIFINYMKVQFLDNFEYLESFNGEEYKGYWRVELINGIWIIQYKEGDSSDWGSIRKIKTINEKYIITEDIEHCNHEGHRNSINEHYYIKN